MSWLGAGIGASIGFAIGGPIGAGIGLWLGSSVSKHKKQSATLERQNQTLFFVSLFSMLGKMAKADGIVSKEEIDTLIHFMMEMKLDEEDKKAAITIFNNAKNDKYSIYEYAIQYKENASIETRAIMYKMLWKVAYSDGVIHQQESAILQKIPPYLGLNSNFYDRLKGEILDIAQDVNVHYNLLGCTSSDSDAHIRKSYKRIIAEYHPDKIQSKGLPKEFVKVANEQTKRINKAYEAIKKSRTQ